MTRFEWKSEYSVGNAPIDADHQGLFALVHQLEAADMTDGFLDDILWQLEQYAEGHFAREEAYMREIDFPGIEEHIAGHHTFIEWLDTVKTTYRRAAESPFLIGDLVNKFLEGWLIKHILEDDMMYCDYVKKSK